jgi:heme/copper-type cytochrome/quinol oxidase subunit 2
VARSVAVACLCALALAGAAFGADAGFTPPDPASPNAERINDSYLWISIFAGGIFLLVEGALVWFIVR